MRWPYPARASALVVGLLVALGLGGASLGLTLYDRLTMPTAPEHELAPGTSVAFVGQPRDAYGSPFGPPRLREPERERLTERIGRVSRVISGLIGPGLIRSAVDIDVGPFDSRVIAGRVIELRSDSVLVETEDGERRWVHEIGGAHERLQPALQSGDEVVLTVRSGPDGRLEFRGFSAGIERGEAQSEYFAFPVIALGTVTALTDDSISVATIRGNDVTIRLPEGISAGNAEVGGGVIVMAYETEDGLEAWEVQSLGRLGDLSSWLPRERSLAVDR